MSNYNDYEELVPHNAVKLIATNSTGDKLRYAAKYKCTVRSLHAHIGGSDATACVIKFDKRPTFGSDTSRGDGDVGEINLPASDQSGKEIIDTPSSRIQLEPGEEIVCEVTTASTADKAVAIEVLVDKDPEVTANLSDRSESS